MNFLVWKRRFPFCQLTHSAVPYLCFFILLVLAVAIRLLDLHDRWLWYDELQSVTHSSLSSIQELMRSVRHFDPHPPLYYIQLHLWMLPEKSTWWIKLNSVLWSTLTLVMIFLASRRLYNDRIAMTACLFFALSPYGILYAQEARMYSMLMFLGISSFYCLHSFIQKPGIGCLLGTVLSALGFLYSHGAGFMILGSLGVYAAWRFSQCGIQAWKKFFWIGLSFAVIFVLYIPWLRQAVAISVGHTLRPNVNEVIHTLFILFFGRADLPGWMEGSAVILITAGILITFVRNRRARVMIGSFIITPIALCLLISYLYLPIWLHRTLAYTTPFWSIALAVLICHVLPVWLKNQAYRKRLQAGLTSLLTLALLVCTIIQQSSFRYHWHFPETARFLQSEVRVGDVVHIPHERIFWGLAWYMAGPGSVDPFKAHQGLTTSSGIHLVTHKAPPSAMEGKRHWLVYRSSDKVKDYVILSDDPPRNFGQLRVTRISP
jgi:uncharacterized membrane protein